jgi:hypothetical protein
MQRSLRRVIEEVAVALATRHDAQVLATGRRYAATLEDAEDAYQRGLEILLTKAPTTRGANSWRGSGPWCPALFAPQLSRDRRAARSNTCPSRCRTSRTN